MNIVKKRESVTRMYKKGISNISAVVVADTLAPLYC
jgi:hypothetical protein